MIPLLEGMLSTFSRENMRISMKKLFINIEFLASLILSIFFTKKIFFDNAGTMYEQIYIKIPDAVIEFLAGNDVLTYLIAVPVLFILITLVIKVISYLLEKILINPLADLIYSCLSAMKAFPRKLILGLSNIPKSLFIVILCVILLNFISYYVTIPMLSQSLNQSETYQFIYDKAIYPILNSNIAKRIPVIVDDTFRKVQGRYLEDPTIDIPKEADYQDGRVRVIRYFNGVTLDEAVKSTSEIDSLAKKITKGETDSREKAYLVYEWITKNIEYDFEKVKAVSKDPKGVTSGTITAFESRKGICFDYSCLFISMCKASGLKVRLITGLGFSGIAWGDHAWNQVYLSEEDTWINVDTTFGTQIDYFDNSDFDVDHKYATIQGEW